MPNKKKSASSKPLAKAWSGRFTQGPDPRAEVYASSLEVDYRLLPYDIVGSQAHAEMLGRRKILSRAETLTLQRGLRLVLKEWETGKLAPQPRDEDVHMLVERRLYALVGAVAGKLHTARSRNDQVITDLKLYLRDEIMHLQEELVTLQRTLIQLAETHQAVIMPGYTHLQAAQPVLAAHWLLAHRESFGRDQARLQNLLAGSLDELPLGAAALAGTSHPIDRRLTAEFLGFSRVTANSMDTVADRDFCLEFLSAAAICGIHLSRLAEELVMFSSAEFGFLTMHQGFATGSSIMPQKRNPDIAELMRGRSGRLLGDLVNLFTVMKGLPLTYNRDLQEDKEPVFDAMDHLQHSLLILSPMLASLTFNHARMRQACAASMSTATEAADHLARQGVPFREAHAAVGRIVTWATEQGRSLEELTLEEWRRFHQSFQPEVRLAVRLEAAVSAKKSLGGTAGIRVLAEIKRLKRLFKIEKKRK